MYYGNSKTQISTQPQIDALQSQINSINSSLSKYKSDLILNKYTGTINLATTPPFSLNDSSDQTYSVDIISNINNSLFAIITESININVTFGSPYSGEIYITMLSGNRNGENGSMSRWSIKSEGSYSYYHNYSSSRNGLCRNDNSSNALASPSFIVVRSNGLKITNISVATYTYTVYLISTNFT